ncbi:MAG: hypothetical protein K8S99_00430 [Planctomycetes bacterium]|nr:hypothetical protein [Planctomycetota bacterium]
MLTTGKDVYILLPGESTERVLHQGTVTECSAEAFVAEFGEVLEVEVGTTLLTHAEFNRKFMQQGATVQAILAPSPKTIIAFRRDGQPINADTRSSYRVSLAAHNLPARINDDQLCRLLDVSATGFGVVSKTQWNVGDVVTATVGYNGITGIGEARVQSVRDAGAGRFRYGLHAVEARQGRSRSDLQIGLMKISLEVQRDQLRRMARA